MLAAAGVLLAAPMRGRGAPEPAPVAVIETSLGKITLELDREHAPATVANFLEYARAGFYDGTIFHRVIDGFMAQGGGYGADLDPRKPARPPVASESRNGLRNRRGTIAMARPTGGGGGTAQFFINLADNPFLDYSETTNPDGYTVFGRVIRGFDVLDRIRQVKTVPNPLDVQPDGTRAASLPATPIVIRSVRIEEAGEGSR